MTTKDQRDRTADDTAPSPSAAAIVPDAAFAKQSRFIWVGGAGNMVVRMGDGVNCTFSGIPAGTLLPLAAEMVVAAGTTATLMVALF